MVTEGIRTLQDPPDVDKSGFTVFGAHCTIFEFRSIDINHRLSFSFEMKE